MPESYPIPDDGSFLTIRHVPVMCVHPPIVKKVRDLKAAGSDNPDGIVDQVMTCDEEDLESAARNSNQRTAEGKPAILQLGHTQFKQMPESYHPKAIGIIDHWEVGDLKGKPCLFADFHYRSEFREDALTYPRLSPERAGWSDPDVHAITAVALLRSTPELDLPVVPYAAGAVGGTLVCYGADLPSPLAEGESPPKPTPPRGEKMEIDKETCETIANMVVMMLHAAKPGTTPEDEALKVETPAATEGANYAAAPAGTNTGYIADDKKKDDKEDEMEKKAKACYAREFAPFRTVIDGLVRKVEGLETLNADQANKIKILTDTAEDAAILSERSNYSRIIDDAVTKDSVSIDEETRNDLIAMLYALPQDRREASLRKQLANYSRSSVGAGFVPGINGHGASHDSEGEERKKRYQWLSVKGLTGERGRQAYEAAKAAGQV